MAAEPTFLVGVGATKAGTSWLYDQLSRHPDCHLRSIKELHFFDLLDGSVSRQQVPGLMRRVADLSAALPAQRGWRLRRTLGQLSDAADWLRVVTARSPSLADYRAYLTRDIGDRRLAADITPSYALLPETGFRAMTGLGQGLRVLYLLRDPVARLWSNVRMSAARRDTGQDFERQAALTMARALDRIESGDAERSDYAGTISRLRAAIPGPQLTVMFQDDLLARPGLDRLCTWLGIARFDAAFDKPVLPGRPLAIPAQLRARALVALRPQYDYVARMFPALPDSWCKTLNEVHA